MEFLATKRSSLVTILIALEHLEVCPSMRTNAGPIELTLITIAMIMTMGQAH